MINYFKLNIFKIILFIVVMLFIVIDISIIYITKLNRSVTFSSVTDNKITGQYEEKIERKIINEEECWIIEIPAIDLKADIREGTTNDIMNKYVGHFSNTEFWQGNIGLAAHNRRLSC